MTTQDHITHSLHVVENTVSTAVLFPLGIALILLCCVLIAMIPSHTHNEDDDNDD